MTYFNLEQVQVRIQRAREEAMTVLSKEVKGDQAKFKVTGSSGKTYTVKVCHKPSCTCPDFSGKKRRAVVHISSHCKHIVSLEFYTFKR
jgi:predicted nucleic acid-binding Zn finger protein